MLKNESNILSNLYDQIPSTLPEEVFQVLAQSENVKIERIVSLGHRSPATGWYDQAENEWVAVLQGEATIEMYDGNEKRLKPGDFILLSAHQKHRVTWTHPDKPTLWLAVHFL